MKCFPHAPIASIVFGKTIDKNVTVVMGFDLQKTHILIKCVPQMHLPNFCICQMH